MMSVGTVEAAAQTSPAVGGTLAVVSVCFSSVCLSMEVNGLSASAQSNSQFDFRPCECC